jgi:hypothetical protein
MPTTFSGLVARFLEILNSFVYLIIALTFAFVVWQIISMWIIHGGDEKKVSEGKQLLLACLIGLVVMFGFWGIIQLVRSSLFY